MAEYKSMFKYNTSFPRNFHVTAAKENLIKMLAGRTGPLQDLKVCRSGQRCEKNPGYGPAP